MEEIKKNTEPEKVTQDHIAEKKQNESPNNKRTGLRILLFVLVGIFAIFIGIFGYLAVRYFFPSNKDLLIIAHAKTIKMLDEKEIPDAFFKTTDTSLHLEGDYTTPKLVNALNTVEFHTENLHLSDHEGMYETKLRFMEEDVLHTKNVSRDGKHVLSSSELLDSPVNGKTSKEVPHLILDEQGIHPDTDLLNGMNEEIWKDYLVSYGMKLYKTLPEDAISVEKTKTGKRITVSADANLVLSGIVSELYQDYGFKQFFYQEREKISKNGDELFLGTSVLLPSMTLSQFEKEYDRALAEFLEDITKQEVKLLLVTEIDENRCAVSDTFSLIKNGEKTLHFYWNRNGSFEVIPYEDDGTSTYEFKNEKRIENGVEYSKITYTTDVREFTKTPELDAKNFSVVVESKTEYGVKNRGVDKLPEQYIEFSKLSKKEQQKLIEDAGTRIKSITAGLTLGIIFVP